MFRILLLACCLMPIVDTISAQSAPVVRRPAVIGYVFPQENVLQSDEVDGQSLTRINYAFANIEGGRIVTGFSHDAENYATLTALRKKNRSLQVLVSVGGWLWSGGFSDVALTAQSRSIFIKSVVEFLARYDLDGLDIDWEYPGMVGAGHVFRSVDKANFNLLLKELRSEFDREQKSGKRRLILSIAAGSSDEFISHTDMKQAQKYLDTVNLMAYDYYEPSSDKLTGHHSPLFTNPLDPKKISSDASVHAFEAAGVPAAKIVLGMPFYGHAWGQVPNQNHGLFQTGAEIPKAYTPYSAVVEDLKQDGFQRFWDPVASVPYLYSPEREVFISYDDPESIAAKCSYVLKHQLGGVMFWEYSGDPSHSLLSTIHDTLSKGTR